MSSGLVITVSGKIGAGKTALMVEIADLLKKNTGLTVEFEEPEMVRQEMNAMTFDSTEDRMAYLMNTCGTTTVVLKEVITP